MQSKLLKQYFDVSDKHFITNSYGSQLCYMKKQNNRYDTEIVRKEKEFIDDYDSFAFF